MGQVVPMVKTERRLSSSSQVLSKLEISTSIQKATLSQGLSHKQLSWHEPQLGEIMGGGEYEITSLLSVLDRLGLKLEIVSKSGEE